MPWMIGAGVFATGLVGIFAQTLLLRELLVCFSGNELTFGVTLSVWLLLEAAGSWLAGVTERVQGVKESRSQAEPLNPGTLESLNPSFLLFAGLTAFSAVAFPAMILFVRLSRPLFGLTPGQVPSLPVTLAIALIALIPVSLPHGALFTTGVRLAGAARRVQGVEGSTNDEVRRGKETPKLEIRNPNSLGFRASDLGTSSLSYSSLALGPGILESSNPSTGPVYSIEILGTAVGGLLLALLLVDRFSSLELAFAAGVAALVSLCPAALVLRGMKPQRPSPPAPLPLGEGNRVRACAHPCPPVVPILTALSALVLALGFGLPASLERTALRRQYPGNETVWSGNSHYGNITELSRGGQRTLLYDGAPAAVLPFPDYSYVEEFAHVAMLSHPDPKRVLLIGGGLGGVLDELAKYPQAAVDYCELDPELIAVARRIGETVKPQRPSPPAPLPLGEGNRVRAWESAIRNPQSAVPNRARTVDGRRFLTASPVSGYDLIIVGFETPTTLQANRYFSREFLSLARSRLAQGGILVMRAPGSTAYLSTELARLNAIQFSTLRGVFPSVRALPGDFNIFLASADDRIMSLGPEEMAERMAQAGLSLRFLTREELTRRFSPSAEADLEGRLLGPGEPTQINTDRHPVEVLAGLSLRASATDAGAGRWFGRLIGLPSWLLFPFVAGLAACFVLGRRRRGFALRFALFSTGLAGAACSLLLLLAYQIVAGTVYYNLILLTTAFMAGAAVGGVWGQRATKRVQGVEGSTNDEVRMGKETPKLEIRNPNSLGFGASDLGTSSLSHSSLALNPRTLESLNPAFFLPLLDGANGLVVLVPLFYAGLVPGAAAQILFLSAAFASGLILGAEFVAVNQACGKGPDVARTAGSLYAADLLGGFLGALLVPVIMVPALGMAFTAVAVALVKVTSAAALRWGRSAC